MFSFVLRTVIFLQDCFQLGLLFCGNYRAFLQLSTVADDVFRIAFVTFDGCDILKVLRSLLTILTPSNCDRLDSSNAPPVSNKDASVEKATTSGDSRKAVAVTEPDHLLLRLTVTL